MIRAPDRKDILINREVNELLLEPLSIAKRVLLYQEWMNSNWKRLLVNKRFNKDDSEL